MYIYKQLDVIKFVSHLRQVGGFLRVLWVSSTNKTDIHDITEILLKVALNTIPLTYIYSVLFSMIANLLGFYIGLFYVLFLHRIVLCFVFT